nr:hypothetical protein [Helicobacter pylori]
MNEQLREFAEILIESVKKKLQELGDYENIEKILDLEEASGAISVRLSANWNF